MNELQPGLRYELAQHSRYEQELIFSEVRKNDDDEIEMFKEGVTEKELLAILISRLTHVYEKTEIPDILSTIRKLKEASFLIQPHLIYA